MKKENKKKLSKNEKKELAKLTKEHKLIEAISKIEGASNLTPEQLKDKKVIKELKRSNLKKEKQAKKEEKQIVKQRKTVTNKYSKKVLDGTIISTTNYAPNIDQYVIELNKVNKYYTSGSVKTHVLKNVDLKVKKGSFVVILGPSGSGKTTLLNLISGLDVANDGDVFIDGTNLIFLKDSHLTEFRRRAIGFIFQQYNLLPHLTAKENAEVGANLATKKVAGFDLNEIFKTIGLDEHTHKFPHQMSGGQQQRVSIARALAKNPSILFCDEPTGALDETTGRIVLNVLSEINKKFHTTIIVVTHNPNIAKIADSVIRIKNGEIVEHVENKTVVSAQDIAWS